MKAIKHTLYAVIIISSLIFYSCSPAYVPNVVNVPLLKEKDDAKLNATFGISGYDIQLAFAVTDNIGVMVNSSFDNAKDKEIGYSGYYHKHNFIEFGLGYFSSKGKFGTISCYGGFGVGNIKSRYNSAGLNWEVDANTTRFFIQPSIGTRKDYYEGAFSSRIVVVKLNNPDYKMVLYIEPVITNKIGFKYGKFVIQTGLSIPISTIDIGYDYIPFMFSVGLELNLGELYKNN